MQANNQIYTKKGTAEDFLDELGRHGLVILGSATRIQGDYLLGVAAKPLPAAGGR